ncbi:MAG TPA: PucR family transcriptional regulator [Actinomycetes bacterium]|nr:PucR family transcriptional regulator [Actinomycetes bacterium]
MSVARPTHRPTIRTILDLPGLDVRLRAGAGGLDHAIRWVAVSELEDPTPYLDGGELLLTTGLRLTDDDFAGYVQRLVDANVSGVGLGVGLTHNQVPHALIDAAEAHGLPVLEIPEPTPFIAISTAVSEFLAAAEYEAVTRTVEAQRELTRAALAPEGAAAVVARLSTALEADTVLFDPAGHLVHAAPREAAALAPELLTEVERLRERGPRSAAAFDLGERRIVMQPLAPAGRVRGFLAVGRRRPFSTPDQALLNIGVALVSLALERSIGTDTARRELRAAVFALLADGIASQQLPIAGVGWDELLAGPVRVLVADGPSADLLEVLEHVEESAPVDHWRGAVVYDEKLAVVVTAGSDDQDLLDASTTLAWGISDSVAVDALGDGLRQARRALAAAGPIGVRRFGDLARHGLVGLVDADAGRGFADGLLGPLEARDRGDLVASVRAWLAHHGQWDAAASTLGVHRHTLRYRMRRVEELLGRSLDDPDLRAELWVALAVRDRDAIH